MDKIIKNKLVEIENEFDVRILFACESGSRAWGFASPNSDYDVKAHYYQYLIFIDENLLGLAQKEKDYILQNYPQSEVADELSIPLGTVKSRVRLAMNKLRKHFI